MTVQAAHIARAHESLTEGGAPPPHGKGCAIATTVRVGASPSIMEGDPRNEAHAAGSAFPTSPEAGSILRLTIGVDPGILGALVVLGDGEPLQFVDMPTKPRKTSGNEVDAFRLASIVRGIMQQARGAHVMAVLEAVSMRPGNSRSSDQKTGEGLGVIKGVMAALGIRWVQVQPQTWKRYFGLLKTEKDVARQFAMNRFQRHAVYLAHKRDNGRGDAALIALWAWETEQHAEVAA